MASANNIKSRTALVAANLCRLLLAVVFMVSGFVKAVDPKGLMYKLQEYASVFAIDEPWLGDVLLPASIALSAAEFILGVWLFMGTNRRLSAIMALLVMLLFTPWTMVLAIWEPVHDCGCFGDAFRLTNWETFAKNVFLLIMASFLWVKRSRIVRFVSTRSSRIVTLFALLYIGYVQYTGLAHLPVMDFRPFAVGADLSEGVRDVPAEFRVLYRYERGGEIIEIESEEAPDTTWNYLGTRSEMISEGEAAKIPDFWFAGMTDGEDIAETLLSDTNYTCLLVLENVSSADESRVDKINDMYDYCVDNGIAFYALTSSLDTDVEQWKKYTGAEYPFYSADNLLLKTMVRSNPGVIVVKGGKVVAKWNAADLPDVYDLPSEYVEENGAPLFMSGVENRPFFNTLFHWVFMLFAPLLLIFLLDFMTRPKGNAAPRQAKAGNVAPQAVEEVPDKQEEQEKQD